MSEAGSIASTAESEYQGNGLVVKGPPFGLEKIYDYEEGGHHPVHLGDILHSRYKVIHKLGTGGYANVWLCRDNSSDTPKYVALKIVIGEQSTKDCPELRMNKLLGRGSDKLQSPDYFCLSLDQFEINGPNGIHLAFVYPVLGPRVSRLPSVAQSDDPGELLKRICLQVTQAMAELHRRGVCHGDYRPANILAQISGLDGLSEDEVIANLGIPSTTKVVTLSGEGHNLPTAPQYLVYPVDWDSTAANTTILYFISDKVRIIDFGESYDIAAPVADLGIPQAYCSPEYTLEGKVGLGCDLWALGCTLFEIRTGRKLFDTYDDEPDEHLWKTAMVLGKFPEPWWSETWKARRDYFEDEADAGNRVIEVRRGSNERSSGPGAVGALVMQRSQPRSLQETLAEGLFYENSHGPGGIQRGIPQREIEIFSDLLSKLLTYTPDNRSTVSCILDHDWFKPGF
ncbi:kinase-like domain-containing protein [Daldinia loculata]|nr:kinase-like domain-containing protein [Daldinia loculata]